MCLEALLDRRQDILK